MPKLKINDIELEVAPGTSVLQACEQLGIEVPRFCYHDKLSVPANCRMCLVEVEKTPKPQASCALPCGEGMVVKTNTPVVLRARKNVMEMLLINHPLDCPICDQGGECDLQDQAVAYGFDRGRYAEAKRAVKDKELGPLVKTVMTRCIHCTRCVRFADEIAGTPVLGGFGRSEHLEIGTYIEKAVSSELSGNLVDVCPVGALTNKPYAFEARPWELSKTETIDVLDAVGSNIRVDTRGQEVMRILPRLHEDVNEEWINDKTRYACDGLKRQRLDTPYVRGVDGKLKPANWGEAFAAIARQLKGLPGEGIAAIAGDLADAEAMFALKQLMQQLKSPNIDCRQDGAQYDVSQRAGYTFNSKISGIEQADVILLVGTNPRVEASLINARIRKRWLRGGLKVGVIGEQADLTYPTKYLGANPLVLDEILQGRNAFSELLKNAKNPMIIVGAGALARKDGLFIQYRARKIAETYNMVREGWNGFNILQTVASRVAGLDMGFVPAAGGMATNDIITAAGQGRIGLLYLLGADEIDMGKLGNTFVVYQGHHGDAGASRADVILPGAAYTEKSALYMNTEGRLQSTRRATFPPGQAKEDWQIIRALSEVLGQALPYDTLPQIRQKMVQAHALFARLDHVEPAPWNNFARDGVLESAPLRSSITNFYQTDVISRASPTMAQCVEAFLKPVAEAAE
ncbi:MAG: NADH-quinone oxidoreductase subunit NuoG [Alphaproteobacteria bacterium]|nr:NADH-quinone oxidoreductase subunit NuoG [Alphaproteobacteria bacterium]